MSDPVAISLITAAASIISAVISLLNNKISRRNLDEIREANSKIGQLEKNTNDKMDKLLETKDALREATNKAQYAAGKLSKEL